MQKALPQSSVVLRQLANHLNVNYRKDLLVMNFKFIFSYLVRTCSGEELKEALAFVEVWFKISKDCFPLGKFVRANRENSNLIGWRQTLTTSPANHIRFLLVRAKEIAKWKTGLNLLR